jgi:acyl carrier protein
MRDQIRQVIAEHARLATSIDEVGDDGDLFAAGMTSHASVNVMLALEDAFGVEFPEAMLRKSTFATVSNLEVAIGELLVTA